MFVDCDDEVEETYVAEMVNLIKRENVDLVVCGYNRVNKNVAEKRPDKKIPIEEFYRDIKDNFYYFQSIWNKIYKTKIIKENSITFPVNRLGEDTLFNIAYISSITGLYNTSLCLYHYKNNEGSLTKVYYPELFEVEKNYQKYRNGCLEERR